MKVLALGIAVSTVLKKISMPSSYLFHLTSHNPALKVLHLYKLALLPNLSCHYFYDLTNYAFNPIYETLLQFTVCHF